MSNSVQVGIQLAVAGELRNKRVNPRGRSLTKQLGIFLYWFVGRTSRGCFSDGACTRYGCVFWTLFVPKCFGMAVMLLHVNTDRSKYLADISQMISINRLENQTFSFISWLLSKTIASNGVGYRTGTVSCCCLLRTI